MVPVSLKVSCLLSYWIFFFVCQYLTFNQSVSEKKIKLGNAFLSLWSNYLCSNHYEIDHLIQLPQVFIQQQFFIEQL